MWDCSGYILGRRAAFSVSNHSTNKISPDRKPLLASLLAIAEVTSTERHNQQMIIRSLEIITTPFDGHSVDIPEGFGHRGVTWGLSLESTQLTHLFTHSIEAAWEKGFVNSLNKIKNKVKIII